MRLKITKTNSATSLYVQKDVYINGKRTTKLVEKLGTVEALKSAHDDPIAWAKEYIQELNQKQKEAEQEILVRYSPTKQIEIGQQHTFNGGYLFLKALYNELGLPQIFDDISKHYKITYDLSTIIAHLVYSRILFPCSKKATHQLASTYLEPQTFDLQHVYRSLEILAKEADTIQSQLFKNSLKTLERDTSVLYYDCTNFFFEIEQSDVDGPRQYGYSKEHRPNPIVQMGLFMDKDGLPIAFDITPGNTNEQTTLQPLEAKIINDYDLSKFIVCTDAGLSSKSNRLFNQKKQRAFVTTQSIKKMKLYLKEWALDNTGWKLPHSTKLYNLLEFDEETQAYHQEHGSVFYKERWTNDDGIEQRLIVTFSFKYQAYQANIRNNQMLRAEKLIASGKSHIKKAKQNDFRRMIKETSFTPDGEVATQSSFQIDDTIISKEAMFDGFYAVCSSLEDDISTLIDINKQRWEIEACFRTMKTEFKARPIHLSREDRIKGHFMTCFLSLFIFKLLQQRLDTIDHFTTSELIHTLQYMNFTEIRGEGFIPSYTRTHITDALHQAFNFRTDFQLFSQKNLKNILKSMK